MQTPSASHVSQSRSWPGSTTLAVPQPIPGKHTAGAVSGAVDSKSQYVYPYLGKALLGGRLISRQPNFYKIKTQRIWNWGAAPSSKPLSFHFVEIGLMR